MQMKMQMRGWILAFLAVSVHAQSYTGCHSHGDVEYCYGPDGEETAMSTQATATTAPATASATSTSTADASSVTGCHTHGEDVYCIDGDGSEVQVVISGSPTDDMPTEYTDCHSHSGERYCVDPDGNDVQVLAEGESADSSSSDSEESGDSTGGMNCHFHAGVEHCVGAGESESSSEPSCGIQTRDYDIPLRIGTLFVVLVTSGIGVFLPMVMMKLPFQAFSSIAFTIIKQFGTGVIISTAFVHLYTHAELMFKNDCLGELKYEATTSAVVMAGIFLSFLTEYIGHRVIAAKSAKNAAAAGVITTDASQDSDTNIASKDASGGGAIEPAHARALANIGHSHGTSFDPTQPTSKLSVMVMEAGVVFHSILIGLTLVVAGDSFYRTLLIVIVFHQFFEGLALGARIALLPGRLFPNKAIMAGVFMIITPIGMAIGMGVLNTFNGNERDTLIALGTLDALSAGILAWVGLVDMWARDWVIEGGELLDASIPRVLTGGVSLISGMVLMGVLGKWA